MAAPGFVGEHGDRHRGSLVNNWVIGSLNVKGAYFEVLGDALGLLWVMVGAVLV